MVRIDAYVQTVGIFLLCEIIGMITEIVSNQYHFAVLNQKVIALQRFFDFGLSSQKYFSLFPFRSAEQKNDDKIPVL